MSGICGIVRLDGAPPVDGALDPVMAALKARGPDAAGVWQDAGCALGHALLATTPEAAVEILPLTDPRTGCTITADVRLDNREELAAALGLGDRLAGMGDGELVLLAYLEWGEDCPRHLLGDFAFAIRDPRHDRLFCARDHMGLRPFAWSHLPGRAFVFASTALAVRAFAEVPREIDEGRIADFLEDLEGIDQTSTFFAGIVRLPPAHTLTLDAGGLSIRRYWELKAPGELRLASDEAYAAAFLDVFTEAVRCRLRCHGPVGSMLSGGMDSGSIVAVASQLLADAGAGPLRTYSAVSGDDPGCVETRAIRAAQAMPGLAPRSISLGDLDRHGDELARLMQHCEEPFDAPMNLPRAVYLLARQDGVRVVLDGAGGDLALNEGSAIARLLRRGRFLKALRETRGFARFHHLPDGGRRILAEFLWRAFVPWRLREWRHRWRRWRGRDGGGESLLAPGFARAVDLPARRRRYDAHRPYRETSLAAERALALSHPNLTVGRERYDRVAGAMAIEPRDPFLDIRVLAFCLSLPEEQLIADGWPKILLRRAMMGRLPDAVRWRRGKEHLGLSFSQALLHHSTELRGSTSDTAPLKQYAPYLARSAFKRRANESSASRVTALANWLDWSIGIEHSAVDAVPKGDEVQ